MAIAYKLFRYKHGKLYPLYICTNEEIPIGQHLVAHEGEQIAPGKVKSKLGALAFRPGWHLTEIPLANHIGKKQPNGQLYQASDTVWCEVEYDDQIDYNPEVQQASKIKREQCLRRVPLNGWYWYTTNNLAMVKWLISGGITVKRILTNQEVDAICRAAGKEPQPRCES